VFIGARCPSSVASDERDADASIGRSLRRLEEIGAIRAGLDIGALTMMINGALNAAALWLAAGGAKKAQIERAEAGLRALIGGLA
jgi:hypothetical protein